jgi:hypothetical protein
MTSDITCRRARLVCLVSGLPGVASVPVQGDATGAAAARRSRGGGGCSPIRPNGRAAISGPARERERGEVRAGGNRGGRARRGLNARTRSRAGGRCRGPQGVRPLKDDAATNGGRPWRILPFRQTTIRPRLYFPRARPEVRSGWARPKSEDPSAKTRFDIAKMRKLRARWWSRCLNRADRAVRRP